MDDGETAKQLIIPGKIPTCRHRAKLFMCSWVAMDLETGLKFDMKGLMQLKPKEK